MRMRPVRLVLAFFLVLVAAGCAAVDPRADLRRVDGHVSAAVGTPVPHRPEDAGLVRAVIDEVLADGLTADEALQLCLLNNPRVRAAYLTVGVARADVVQAGLFSNPTLSISLRLPDGGGLSNVELAVAQRIAELWLLPARKRAAEGELQRQLLTVAREISTTALDTRAAYFAALAAEHAQALSERNCDLARQLLDAAVARQQAGVGSEIDVNLARTELMQTEVAARTAAQAAFDARQRLVVLLGLDDSPDTISLSDELPNPPSWRFAEDHLVQNAALSRLDLVAAGYVVQTAAARVEQEKRSVFTDVEVGVSVESTARGRRGDRPWLADTLWASAEAGQLAAPSLRPREALATDTVVGPSFAFALPIFDQNQAQIARAQYLHEAARASHEALLVQITQETRGAARRAQTAWDVARYYNDHLLPLAETNLALARDAYRSGKLSLLAVLEAQKSLLAARQRYVETLRDGVVALVELEKAVGLPAERLVESAAPSSATQPTSTQPTTDQP